MKRSLVNDRNSPAVSRLLARMLVVPAALLGSLALTALAGCAAQPGSPVMRPAAMAELNRERFSGPNSPAALFNPPIVLAAAAEPAELPPMEAFNWRPTWPASAGVRLPEVTRYQEYYYDRQASTGQYWGGWGGPANYFNRTFRSYRSGIVVK